MTFLQIYEPGNMTRYTVTASELPEDGFQGAGNKDEYYLFTVYGTRRNTTYPLGIDSHVSDGYFRDKFDPERAMSMEDREQFRTAIHLLMYRIRENMLNESSS